ncbi:MAG TPA: NERD nuclease [Ruminococcaceae bacterium]|jgi:hypothetical protein|nr:NERD nuclease [Oscillospiraceae bacterium]
MLLLVFIIAIVLLKAIVTRYIFNKTTYHKITNNSYYETIHNPGRKGEYQIFKHLQFLEKEGCKFLFNVYLPKDNDETTEIDVLLLTPKGIIVFESKNYSGWIFGNEKYKSWTQTLPQGRTSRKEHFFNPIMQNKLHVKCLKNIIGENCPVHPIVVFSEKCTLKNITFYSEDVQIVKLNSVCSAVSKVLCPTENSALSDDELQRLYDLLYPYSQVSEQVKQKHIRDIRSNHFE